MTDFSSYSDRALCQIIREAAAMQSNEFAMSMTEKVMRFGASEKQRFWLEKLAREVETPEPAERVKTPVGDLSGVMALFDKARKHLKAPAIVIGMGDEEIRLSVAGATARAPGTINVATNGGYGNSTWYGRILLDGQFEASPRVPTPDHLVEGLKRFAAEPAKMAAEHGSLTGRCCFCARELTDERSIAVGYGKTCSERWGVPYPTLAEARGAAPSLFDKVA